MYGLDMINTSVLGALGCDMNTFLRYFPAAETMYSLLVALAIGLILLGWVWNLFKNYGLGLGVDAEDPVKLTAKAILFIVLAYYADEIVNIALTIGGTPYAWILSSELPSLDFASFNSVLLLGTVLLLALTLAVPAFALEESDVEAAVSSSSREAVTGNVLVWFLCAVGFLKVSQKIDSFMASIGVNVGHTGGSMLGEAMVAFKGVSLAAGMAGKAVGNFADRASSRAGGAASGSSGFLQGGLAGVVSRKITNDAVRTATQTTQKASSSTMSAAHQATERTVNAERQAASVVHQAKQTRSESASQKSQMGVTHQQVASSTRTASVSSLRRESQHSVGLGGRIFTNSMLEGGRFANDVIGMVAAGDLHSTGSITGEFASQALSSYMGITAQGDAAPQISYSNIEIGGGRITGTEYSPEHPDGISFGMYHTGQYAAPDGEHQKVFSADGVQWYKQYAVDTVIKKPFTAPDGEIDYHKEIVKKMPDPPKRKDRM